MTPVAATAGVHLYQLIEPDRLWAALRLGENSSSALDAGSSVDVSLGLPLLGLLLVTLWANAGGGTRSAGAARLSWSLTLTLGLTFVFLSLAAIASRLSLIPITVGESWRLLLLAIPFLTVAAVRALTAIPGLKHTPVWAALLILPLLAAAPHLSPAFAVYDIPTKPAAVFGDNQFLLMQVDTEGALQPGATVTVVADWLALRPADFDYNVFLHVIDAEGNRWAQIDAQPQTGARPMTSWRPGEIISDRYEIDIPADAPADLRLLLGLYNWQTLERIPIGAADVLELYF